VSGPLIPDNIVPLLFTAGQTVKFTREFNDFSNTDWAYTIYFNGASNVFHKAGVNQGNGWLITLTPTDLAVAAGIYRYIERLVNAATPTPTGEVYTVGDGVAQIEVDLATAPAGAMLTFWEKTLAVVEAALSGRLTSDLQSYQIAGRAVQKIPIKELMQIRGYAKSMIRQAAMPNQIGEPVRVEFVDEVSDAAFPPTWVDVTGLPGAGQ
jgi:hypothetical protein